MAIRGEALVWELKRGCCVVCGRYLGDDDLKIRNLVLQSRRFRLGDLVVGLISELRSGVELSFVPRRVRCSAE